jgi:hopanoid biosynthesis associated RND transporter like protein HpnN
MLNQGEPEQKQRLVPFFDQLAQAFERAALNQPYSFSWQKLIAGKDSALHMKHQFIIIEPAPREGLSPTQETAVEAVNRIRNELQPQRAEGVRVRMTGEVALNAENLLTVRESMGITTLFSFLLVTIAVIIGLGSKRLVLASLLTLLTGLIWTFGFAIAVVGYLNMISVTFTVLFIGLCIDYGIQFCLRYREEMASGYGHHDALLRTAAALGVGLRLCSIAAAIGFYSFLPTTYIGVSQLGLIAGTGMLINLFATLTVLPALLIILMPLKEKKLKEFTGGRPFYLIPARYARTIRMVAAVAGICALFFIPKLSFDYNPLNLYSQHSEAISTIKELFGDEKSPPWTLSVLARSEKEAREWAARIKDVKEVKAVLTMADFIPDHQPEKLAIISDIALLMPPEFGDLKSEELTHAEEVTSLDKLQKTLKESRLETPNNEYGASITRFSLAVEQFGKALNGPVRGEEIFDRLEKNLLSDLPYLMNQFKISLRAHQVTQSDLPQEFLRLYVSPEGIHRVEILPKENLMDFDTHKRFVQAVRAVAPNAIGNPVAMLEAGEAVFESFKQATLYALVAISIYLLIEIRRPFDILLILLPIILSLLLTGAASVVLGLPFNFANVIVIPLLIGSGVEGTFLIYRIRKEPPADGCILNTSTARALFFSTLTTILSFSTLSFSSHQGMASMGKLLTICIISLMVATLLLLPALLCAERPKETNPLEPAQKGENQGRVGTS